MFKEKEDLDSWFIDPHLYIDRSDIHGVGIFTNADLPQGKVIEVAPVIISHNDSFFADLEEYTSSRHILTDYLFHWSENTVAFPLGWAGLYNHEAHTPNCTWKCLRDLPGLAFITKRKINAGDELCTRYVPLALGQSDDPSVGLWFAESNDRTEEILRGERVSLRAHEVEDVQKRTKKSTKVKNKWGRRRLNEPETMGSLLVKRKYRDIVKNEEE
jgi:hypothetical protein